MRWLRILGILIAALVLLVVVAAATVYALSERAINRKYHVEVAPLERRTDPGAIEHGRHVAMIRGCTDCHAPDLGGRVVIDDPMAGRLAAPNITAGRTTGLTDEDFVRAVRHGLRRDGGSLLLMPSYEYWYLSDDDLSALLAYVRSVPSVERAIPRSQLALPLRAILLFSDDAQLLPAASIDHDGPRPEPPREGDVQALGRYLVVTCTGCHGAGLGGGRIPGVGPDWPPASNLTPAGNLETWTFEQFVAAMRGGRTPDGRQLNPRYMPWPSLGAMTDAEMAALWDHLRALPARETGSR